MKDLDLTTERTRLRPLTPAEVDFMHALSIDSAVRKYLWDDTIISRDRAAEVVEASCRTFAERRYGLWAIHLKEGRAPIGFCGLRPSETDAPELLYGLWPGMVGSGAGHRDRSGGVEIRFFLGTRGG